MDLSVASTSIPTSKNRVISLFNFTAATKHQGNCTGAMRDRSRCFSRSFTLTLGSDEPGVFLVTKIAVFAPYGGPAHCWSQLVYRVTVSFRCDGPVNPFSANPPHFTHGTQNDFIHNCLLSLFGSSINSATEMGARRFMSALAAIFSAFIWAEPLITTHPVEKMTISSTIALTAPPHRNGLMNSFFI